MSQESRELQLHSTIDPDFYITIDERVIKFSDILINERNSTANDTAIDVKMTKKELEFFVKLHELYDTADAPSDFKKSNEMFEELPHEDLKSLVFNANYLDSQRFLEAIGQFVLSKLDGDMTVKEAMDFMCIKDDYTKKEREAMENNSLDFFTKAAELLSKTD